MGNAYQMGTQAGKHRVAKPEMHLKGGPNVG